MRKDTKKYELKMAKRERNKADKAWREAVLNDWQHKCAYCETTQNLNCHHIIPRQIKELRHEVKNGIVLCVRHHKFSYSFSAHKNSFAFCDWLLTWHLERCEFLLDKLQMLRLSDSGVLK